ncbi:MAG: helix-turn-helix transcriptional regulator [Treponema sp.]|nr:helix-turn-helix transcriptional regulator [Treponema sp.]
MTFGEKLRESRKDAGLSQEGLAEKLNVSRQAITKWETNAGIPDIANLMAISNLFGITLDDFVSEEKLAKQVKSRLYESTTEYDIDGSKSFDIKLGGAKSISVCGGGEEKIKVVLSSDTLSNIQQDFKTKIDDVRNRIDINVNRAKQVSESAAKEQLYIEVILPNKYISGVELDASCEVLSLANVVCEDIEFDGRASQVNVDGLDGTFEINCNLDMKINASGFNGAIELNQIKSTSRIVLPKNLPFRSVKKGIGNTVIFEENGSASENFSSEDSENVIELTGMNSELIIERK